MIPAAIPPDKDQPAELCVPGMPDTASLHGLTVLVAEDNKLNWVVLKKYLSSWKIKAEHAADGLAALEKMRTTKYDMVFMDLQMPVMDGFTAAMKIRKELKYTEPVIAITADALAKQQHDLPGFGFTDAILKPFRQKELAAAMIRVLSDRSKQPVEKL
jgi:CheY-like chemotaxis protein